MTHKKEHGTHSCCNKRLKDEGGKATCCHCNPHEGCEMTQPNKAEGWEERFDKIFDGELESYHGSESKAVKQFISTLLAEKEKELKDMTENAMCRICRKVEPIVTCAMCEANLWAKNEKEIKTEFLRKVMIRGGNVFSNISYLNGWTECEKNILSNAKREGIQLE